MYLCMYVTVSGVPLFMFVRFCVCLFVRSYVRTALKFGWFVRMYGKNKFWGTPPPKKKYFGGVQKKLSKNEKNLSCSKLPEMAKKWSKIVFEVKLD